MQKIATLFMRDYSKAPTAPILTPKVRCGNEWVLAGEGITTVKFDGLSCLVRSGRLYKRVVRRIHDHHKGPEWMRASRSVPGWQPVGQSPADAAYHAAFDPNLPDGTYELVGPDVEGNPYNLGHHALWQHGIEHVNPPRTFAGLKRWLEAHWLEGLVWHHADGRMAKIKRKDFGLPWGVPSPHQAQPSPLMQKTDVSRGHTSYST